LFGNEWDTLYNLLSPLKNSLLSLRAFFLGNFKLVSNSLLLSGYLRCTSRRRIRE